MQRSRRSRDLGKTLLKYKGTAWRTANAGVAWRAEAALGEGTNSQKALLLLARARILDRADNPGCKAVVEQSRQLLAQ